MLKYETEVKECIATLETTLDQLVCFLFPTPGGGDFSGNFGSDLEALKKTLTLSLIQGGKQGD